jgi:hypothetical protein
VTAVHPPARFGELALAGDRMSCFSEKPQTSTGLIDGGFVVFGGGVLDRVRAGGSYSLEHGLPRELAEARGRVMVVLGTIIEEMPNRLLITCDPDEFPERIRAVAGPAPHTRSEGLDGRAGASARLRRGRF